MLNIAVSGAAGARGARSAPGSRGSPGRVLGGAQAVGTDGHDQERADGHQSDGGQAAVTR